ncbi:hypothetical protein, partial [Isoptericola croceus]|uniref:hypothetical protein n=1 Tax=Isoptericola croceus TaxID=3031406 RepID=UPI0023F8D60E
RLRSARRVPGTFKGLESVQTLGQKAGKVMEIIVWAQLGIHRFGGMKLLLEENLLEAVHRTKDPVAE